MPIFVQPQPASPHLGYRASLLSGEAGTAQTIALMRHLVDEAQADSTFVRKAVEIVRSVPAYDDLGELYAIFWWVRSNIRFTKDPVSKEKLYPLVELLKIRAGDCDDIAMLIGALGMAIGYPARLVTIAANPRNPDEFSHVYAELELIPGSGQWVPMDAARSDSEFGVAPAVYFRKRAWSLEDSGYQDLSGLRGDWVAYDEIVTGRPGPGRFEILLHKKAGQGLNGCLGCGMGQLDPGTEDLLSQSLSELPTLIAVSSGTGSSVNTPYGSFVTQYTPGYGVPAAGYGASAIPSASATLFSSMLPWILVGVVGLAIFSGKGRG